MFKPAVVILLLLTVFSGILPARTSTGSAGIIHSLHKLNTLGSVMYIAAHPDDENTRLLAWLANERKYRTVYLSLTRGDGGQNLIGGEQGRMLGLIRTEELLAARRMDGAEQWFTNAFDFGYSKSPEETFRFWDREKVLGEVVYAIRKFRPDVIITRFPATGEGGHGHHTASAVLAMEAFEKAGDPKAFPEQLASVSVWKPVRLFWNTFNFGGNNTTSDDQLQVDVGGYNPVLGMSYGEIAALSRSCHKSQGFGSAAQRGSQKEFFKQLLGDPAVNDLFDGVDAGWNRLGDKGKITGLIRQCISKFDVTDPAGIIPDLKRVYQAISPLNSEDRDTRYWKELKLEELNQIILHCAGVWAETRVDDNILVENSSAQYTTSIIVRSRYPVKLLGIYNSHLAEIDTTCNMLLETNRMFSFRRNAFFPASRPSAEYWVSIAERKNEYAGPVYRYDSPENRSIPATFLTFDIEGLRLQAEIPVVFKQTDPVKGEIYKPVEILPPVTVTPSCRVLVLNGKQAGKMRLLVRANKDNLTGRLVWQGGVFCKVQLSDTILTFKNKGEEITVDVDVQSCEPGEGTFLLFSIIIEGKVWDIGIERIQYDHIPPRFMLTRDAVKVVNINSPLPVKRIAFIPGAGDEMPSCLKQIGFDVELLEGEKLRFADLRHYDAVVCGIRAYNINPDLFLQQDKLMEYVRNGGRLIVQYNTNSRAGPLMGSIGPYPFNITRKRVTDELAHVVFVDTACSFLNFPNRISAQDFDHWIQERGVYFAEDMDSAYRTVFSMHDPGEEPLQGSLIYARYGKGVFVYTGLSFFRQLPAGVPGAYRLFINLLSCPVNKQ